MVIRMFTYTHTYASISVSIWQMAAGKCSKEQLSTSVNSRTALHSSTICAINNGKCIRECMQCVKICIKCQTIGKLWTATTPKQDTYAHLPKIGEFALDVVCLLMWEALLTTSFAETALTLNSVDVLNNNEHESSGNHKFECWIRAELARCQSNALFSIDCVRTMIHVWF